MFKEGHYILTGDVNSGKSSRLMELCSRLNAEGTKISGWLTFAHPEGVQKGYDIIFLVNSKELKRMRLARAGKFEGAVKWRRFWFDEIAFAEIGKINFGRPDIFIIDEVGPLELEDGKGFWPYLSNIYDSNTCTITVVRLSCVEAFKSVFPDVVALAY